MGPAWSCLICNIKLFKTQNDGQFACEEETDEEEESCDMTECQFTEWGDWSLCSGELCGGPGTNTRTRDCIPAVSNFNLPHPQ